MIIIKTVLIYIIYLICFLAFSVCDISKKITIKSLTLNKLCNCENKLPLNQNYSLFSFNATIGTSHNKIYTGGNTLKQQKNKSIFNEVHPFSIKMSVKNLSCKTFCYNYNRKKQSINLREKPIELINSDLQISHLIPSATPINKLETWVITTSPSVEANFSNKFTSTEIPIKINESVLLMFQEAPVKPLLTNKAIPIFKNNLLEINQQQYNAINEKLMNSLINNVFRKQENDNTLFENQTDVNVISHKYTSSQMFVPIEKTKQKYYKPEMRIDNKAILPKRMIRESNEMLLEPRYKPNIIIKGYKIKSHPKTSAMILLKPKSLTRLSHPENETYYKETTTIQDIQNTNSISPVTLNKPRPIYSLISLSKPPQISHRKKQTIAIKRPQVIQRKWPKQIHKQIYKLPLIKTHDNSKSLVILSTKQKQITRPQKSTELPATKIMETALKLPQKPQIKTRPLYFSSTKPNTLMQNQITNLMHSYENPKIVINEPELQIPKSITKKKPSIHESQKVTSSRIVSKPILTKKKFLHQLKVTSNPAKFTTKQPVIMKLETNIPLISSKEPIKPLQISKNRYLNASKSIKTIEKFKFKPNVYIQQSDKVTSKPTTIQQPIEKIIIISKPQIQSKEKTSLIELKPNEKKVINVAIKVTPKPIIKPKFLPPHPLRRPFITDYVTPKSKPLPPVMVDTKSYIHMLPKKKPLILEKKIKPIKKNTIVTQPIIKESGKKQMLLTTWKPIIVDQNSPYILKKYPDLIQVYQKVTIKPKIKKFFKKPTQTKAQKIKQSTILKDSLKVYTVPTATRLPFVKYYPYDSKRPTITLKPKIQKPITPIKSLVQLKTNVPMLKRPQISSKLSKQMKKTTPLYKQYPKTFRMRLTTLKPKFSIKPSMTKPKDFSLTIAVTKLPQINKQPKKILHKPLQMTKSITKYLNMEQKKIMQSGKIKPKVTRIKSKIQRPLFVTTKPIQKSLSKQPFLKSKPFYKKIASMPISIIQTPVMPEFYSTSTSIPIYQIKNYSPTYAPIEATTIKPKSILITSKPKVIKIFNISKNIVKIKTKETTRPTFRPKIKYFITTKRPQPSFETTQIPVKEIIMVVEKQSIVPMVTTPLQNYFVTTSKPTILSTKKQNRLVYKHPAKKEYLNIFKTKIKGQIPQKPYYDVSETIKILKNDSLTERPTETFSMSSNLPHIYMDKIPIYIPYPGKFIESNINIIQPVQPANIIPEFQPTIKVFKVIFCPFNTPSMPTKQRLPMNLNIPWSFGPRFIYNSSLPKSLLNISNFYCLSPQNSNKRTMTKTLYPFQPGMPIPIDKLKTQESNNILYPEKILSPKTLPTSYLPELCSKSHLFNNIENEKDVTSWLRPKKIPFLPYPYAYTGNLFAHPFYNVLVPCI